MDLIIALASLAGVIALATSFMLGFHMRTISERLQAAEQGIRQYAKNKIAKPEPEEETSTFIDLDDPATRLKYEHEEMLKRLNPEDDE